MSKKTIICTKNTLATVNMGITEPISSNAVQNVILSSKNPKDINLTKNILQFSKNKESDYFEVICSVTGNNEIFYEIDGDYTNQKIRNKFNIIVIDEVNVQNGFYNINGCTNNVVYINSNNNFGDGNTLGYYKSDGSSHVIDIESNNPLFDYELFVIDPVGNQTIHTGTSISINIPSGSSGVWKFIPTSDYFISVDGSYLTTPGTQLKMIADTVDVNTIFVYKQGISYFEVNNCNINMQM